MAVFSFHPVKQITTGEGGAVAANDLELLRKLRLFRNHGMVREEDELFWRFPPDYITRLRSSVLAGRVSP